MVRETTYGMTKSAICWRTTSLQCVTDQGKRELTILEPTATPRLRVNLSLTETVTAVTCSAAFPTIGSRITPTNSLLIAPVSVNPLMESTRNSAVTATNYVHQQLVVPHGAHISSNLTTVTTTKSPMDTGTLICGTSASSSDCIRESTSPNSGSEIG